MAVRVLHVLTRAHRRGAESFGVVLHDELVARGVDSRVVALSPAPAGQAPIDVPVLGPTPRHRRSLRDLRRLAREVDVVIAHGSDTLLACRVALLGARTPFVYVNIGDPLHWSGTPVRRARVAWMLRGAAAVGAIAPSAVGRLAEHFSLPAERVVFTGNGRDPGHFRPATADEKARARSRFGIPVDARVVVQVASLSHEKRVEVAVQAVGLLPDVTLLVVGGGPLEARLRRVAAEVAPGRVTFTGVLADVRDAYRAADVAVLTSETEGLPGVLVEAALSGLPVVATDVGFVRDVVPDGTGLLVPVGDAKATAAAISRCIAEPTWGVTARDRCERTFDLVSAVDRWLALLHQVCVHRH